MAKIRTLPAKRRHQNPAPGAKLSDAQQRFVIEQIAQFHPVPEIIARLKEESGTTVTAGAIDYYQRHPRWMPLIDRCRQEFAQRIAEVPLAHKKVRLLRLEALYQQIEADPNLHPRARRTELRNILDSARKEMDEAKTQFTQIFVGQVQHLTTDELKERRLKILDQLKAGEISDG